MRELQRWKDFGQSDQICYLPKKTIKKRKRKRLLVCVCLADLPGVPSVPEVSEVTSESCHLAWSPPRSDGGTPITGYIIERRTDVGGRWIPLKVKPATNELDVTDLFEDQKYEFRVIAENKVGAGKPGEPSGPIVAKSPWSKSWTRLIDTSIVLVSVLKHR